MKRALAVPLVCLVALAGTASSAWAHAILVHATPAPHATVQGPELRVELKFNSRIDAKRSRVTIVMPDKSTKVLANGESGSPDTLAARGQGFAPGEYRLKWQVLSADGHITRGEHPFTVQ
jgi:methionine-rich copper-binding protein CopC